MLKRRSGFIVCWMLVIILAGFYLSMLILGKNPKVGIEYRMYYITHELSDWPGFGKLSYDINTVEYCTQLKDRQGKEFSLGKVCKRKGKGFESVQYDGSMSKGDNSYIYYILKQDVEKALLEFEINDYFGDGTVSVYVNDLLAGSFDKAGEYSFSIGDIKKEELMTIRFESKDSDFSIWKIMISANI